MYIKFIREGKTLTDFSTAEKRVSQKQTSRMLSNPVNIQYNPDIFGIRLFRFNMSFKGNDSEDSELQEIKKLLKDPSQRSAGLRRIGDSENLDYLPFALEHIDDTDPNIRYAAVDAILKISVNFKLETLLESGFFDKNSAEALEGGEKLDSSTRVDIGAALLHLLIDPDAKVRKKVEEAIKKISINHNDYKIYSSVRAVIDKMSPAINVVKELFNDQQKNFLEYLIKENDRIDPILRIKLLRNLYEIAKRKNEPDGTEYIKWLESLLNDNDPSVRAGAAQAIVNADEEDEMNMVSLLILDPDPNVRHTAADLIIRSQCKRQSPYVRSEQFIKLLLRHEDPYVKAAGLCLITKVSSGPDAQSILKFLDEEDEDVKYAAVRAIKGIGKREFAQFMLPLLKADAEYYKEYPDLWKTSSYDKYNSLALATEIIADSGFKEYVPLAESLINHENAAVRRSAVNLIGISGNIGHLPLLKEHLCGANIDFKIFEDVLNAYGNLGNANHVKDLKPLLNSHFFGETDLCFILNTIQRIANKSQADLFKEFVCRNVDEHSTLVSQAAINALGKLGNKTHHDFLISVLKHNRLDVSQAICIGNALQKLTNEDTVAEMIKLLDHPVRLVGVVALDVIKRIAKPEHYELLKPYLKNDLYKYTIIEIIEDKENIKLIKPDLYGESREKRGEALDLLAKIGDRSHINLVLQFIEDSISGVIINKPSALEINMLPRLEVDISPALLFIVQHGNNGDIDKIAHFFQDGLKYITPDIIDALSKREDKRYIKLFEHIINLLLPRLSDDNKFVNSNALKLLGKIGNARHIKYVLPFLDHEEELLVGDAACAIAKLGGSDYFDIIKSKSTDSHYASYILKGIGDSGVKDYINFAIEKLESWNPSIRAAAVYAIGNLGDESHIELISQFLHDLDKDVIESAIKSIVTLGNSKHLNLIKHLLIHRNRHIRECASDAYNELSKK